ncbi:MAG TPA: NAD(P)H-dependent oxidoreductase subunit E [Geminicoccaceae bacterium]|nr:NAD(P)H-dependent oxidoreductase subunit E [Geminicoccaceae bacterium]
MATITVHERQGGEPGPRPLERMVHPGSGRRSAPVFNKGRRLDEAALGEVAALLDGLPRDRDLLIEHLHSLQEHFGCLQARHLHALAELMRLPMAEVYEVASFYAHFDIVLDEEAPPPRLTVRVCDSLSCELAGAGDLMAALAERLEAAEVRVVRAPCMGRCSEAPAVEVGHRHLAPATPERVAAAIAAGELDPEIPAHTAFDAYVAAGGYRLLRRLRSGPPPPQSGSGLPELLDRLDASGLRGLGGAGFPTFRKWDLVGKEPAPRHVVVNADEGEPGTFKDRWHLERDPHRFLEGLLIAAWAVDAAVAWIYLRDEYPHIRRILQDEILRLESEGLAAPGFVRLRRGAGAYICGEESAMIESVEGKRGLPRHRPPYVAQVGLFGRPTLVNNVETLFWVRDIVERGPEWFASQGRHGSKGLRSYSVSGRVKEPGVKLAPAGITARELIHEFCGGMADGHAFRAYLPGGASGGILPAAMADIPLDFGKLEPHGCFVGSHAVVILSDRDDLKAVARNLMRFFEDESCGQCTPCRNGTEKAVRLMERDRWDVPLLTELAAAMRDASICGLGQAAPNPLLSLFRHFPEEVAPAGPP